MLVVKRILAALVPLALLGVLAAWSIASPVGASPDEDYHLASVWCGQGLREGICEAGPTEDSRRVASRLTQSADCYSFRPEASAACALPDDDIMGVTKRGNFVGDYPPVYYWTLGLFATPDISTSVIVMRVFNATLFVGLATALWLLLTPRRRSVLVWTTAITIVPLGMFLIPSINPSGWAITSAAFLLLALIGFAETDSIRKRIGLGAVAAVAAVIGSGARSDSAAYTVLAVVVAVLLTWKRGRAAWVLPALGLVLAVVAVIFFRASGQSGVVDTVADAENTQADPKALLFTNLTLLPGLWAGVSGTWGLGWLDTVLPAIVWVSVLASFFGVVFMNLRGLRWRRSTSLALIMAALVMVPMYVLTNEQIFVGAGVQPRYIYPLLIMFATVALLDAPLPRVGLSRVQTTLIIVLLAVANSIALHTNLRRYVVGVDVKGISLNIGIEWWWWRLPFGPNTDWIAGSLAFFFALVVGAFILERVSSRPVVEVSGSRRGADEDEGDHAAPSTARTDSAAPAAIDSVAKV